MVFLLILIITEVFTFVIIRSHFYDKSWMRYYFLTLFNIVLSIWLWMVWFQISLFRGFFDDPRHTSLLLTMAGLTVTVVIPRIILIFSHFAGIVLQRNTRKSFRLITGSGLIAALLVFAVTSAGTLFGRFNFHTENITVKIKGLHRDLEGLKIVQLSDIHLPSFYNHREKLLRIMEEINCHNPDLIMNTGDFINYGWREFNGNDTILNVAKSRYGNFAVMGNHDFGGYHPYYTEADLKTNVLLMNSLINASGYRILNDEFTIVNVGDARIGLAGVITMGSFPKIIHGDLEKAVSGMDTADLKILLSHDPNHWVEKVKGKTDIRLTLSGHTHGMQVGILTKNFKWSPAKYFYPCWNGLYSEGEQVLVANRGLGVLGLPLRIWMPPEITVITLKAE